MSANLYAPCSLGLEGVLAAELAALGAADVAEKKGGCEFSGDRRLIYAANLWLRSAIRVQERLLEEPARGPDALYRAVRAFPWEQVLAPDQTLAIDASVRDSAITHSGFVALKAKDAIVDRLRDLHGRRPSVDTEDPDLPLKLVLKKDVLALDRNTSGESLHKRGYRPIQVKSPLNEAIAAGLLQLTGWDRNSPLLDPMCGSGTFLIEAALLAADRAPGLQRRFAFERWRDFDAPLWQSLKDEARARARPTLPFAIEGADRHAGSIALAEKAAEAAGVASLIRLAVADAAEFVPATPPAIVVTNPPWGERLAADDLDHSWQVLGNFLHQRARGAAVFVLCGNADLTRHLGMRATKKWSVAVGPIDCRFLRYDVFKR